MKNRLKIKCKILGFCMMASLLATNVVKAQVGYSIATTPGSEHQKSNRWIVPSWTGAKGDREIHWNISNVIGPYLNTVSGEIEKKDAKQELVLIQGESYTVNIDAKAIGSSVFRIPEAFMIVDGEYGGEGYKEGYGEKILLGNFGTDGRSKQAIGAQKTFTAEVGNNAKKGEREELRLDFFGLRGDFNFINQLTVSEDKKRAIIQSQLIYYVGSLVKFDLNGGNVNGEESLKPQVVKYKEKLSGISLPEKPGYQFIGWINEEGEGFDPTSDLVVSNMTLKAQYEKEKSSEQPPIVKDKSIHVNPLKKATWDSDKKAYKVEISVKGEEKVIQEKSGEKAYFAVDVRGIETLNSQVEFVEDAGVELVVDDIPQSLEKKENGVWGAQDFYYFNKTADGMITWNYTKKTEKLEKDKIRTLRFYVRVKDDVAKEHVIFSEEKPEKNIVKADIGTGDFEAQLGYGIVSNSDIKFYVENEEHSDQTPVAVIRPVIMAEKLVNPIKKDEDKNDENNPNPPSVDNPSIPQENLIPPMIHGTTEEEPAVSTEKQESEEEEIDIVEEPIPEGEAPEMEEELFEKDADEISAIEDETPLGTISGESLPKTGGMQVYVFRALTILGLLLIGFVMTLPGKKREER